MRKIFFLIVLILSCEAVGHSQVSSQLARKITSGTGVPNSACTPGPSWTSVYIRTTTGVIYRCTAAPSTWTALPIAASGAITSSGLTMATNKLLGRGTASTGAVEEITLGTGLSLAGTTLNAAVTSPAGSNTQVQFNDSSAFGGDAGLVYNKTTDTLTASGGITAGGNITSGFLITVPTGGYFNFADRGNLTAPANGVFRLADTAETSFNRLVFGGTTSSFGAVKRFGNTVGIRRADDTIATFTTLTACSAAGEGASAPVSDSSTATWGDTITGGGANRVLAYCNGTNWTVAAK